MEQIAQSPIDQPRFDFAHARGRMVETQLRRRGISDPDVLRAMAEVPREIFVEEGFEEFAYEDSPLPIPEGQTISQPWIVARMLEAAEVAPHSRVLEVGAGSGYAAAVLSRLAAEIFAIERLPKLAHLAVSRFRRLGYRNIALKIGDGSLGWPEAAPFDAILVAAAAPEVPESLKTQLEIGGRLVVPAGGEEEQRLIRITRTGQDAYSEEVIAPVRFVPLIGEAGFKARDDAAAIVRRAAEPLVHPHHVDFALPFDRFGSRRVVMLGEASHGTCEFYLARAAITRRLIEHHGFSAVAVEADWPDAAAINTYVTHQGAGSRAERAFERFPTWMWRNAEFEEFVHWLRDHNENLAPEKRVRFYGLDIYNMRGSIAAVLAYLDKTDKEAARIARQRYGCLTPWQRDPAIYGQAVLTRAYEACEEAVVAQCRDLLKKELDYAERDGAQFFDAAQNARLVAAAERYYRIMYYGGAESWNLRDTHMFDTLRHILEQHGGRADGPAKAPAKAVVWAHNSHIGDARETGMGSERDEINIGQLTREALGADAALIGFGTHQGSVAAASEWDAPMEVMTVRPSLAGSWEKVMHDSGPDAFLLDMKNAAGLGEERLERFIGVIYRPQSERLSHYVEARLARQFDAYVWFDKTHAVTPLKGGERKGVPETYPFGL